MSKVVALTFLLVFVPQICVGEVKIGDTVVAVRDFELKVGGVVVKKAFVGEQFLVQAIEGDRLLLNGAGSVWGDAKEFLELEAAVKHFTLAIERNPKDWQALCARGRARESLGHNYSAMNDLDEAVRVNPCCETYRRRGGRGRIGE